MNILFLNVFKPTSNASGGIARVTCNLGNMFTLNGYRCAMAYYYGSAGVSVDSFESTTQLTIGQEQSALEELAATYQVFILQVQINKTFQHLIPILDAIRKRFGTKVVYCHHTIPFNEAAGYDFRYLRFLLFHSSDNLSFRLRDAVWCLVSMLLPRYSIRRIAKRRQYVTDHVDKVVLLSKSFIPVFRRYVSCPDSKVTAIGNCVTFDDVLPQEKIGAKEKTVLVVSNMNERAKRITEMLHIWRGVSKNDSLADWRLILVGDGQDLAYYKKLAHRLRLRNCTFVGRQNPQSYYEKGSILLLTSAHEGFGMVILEAQQMGCVPVVYESYESVHDLITDGQNGLLIPNRNRKIFISRLARLMENERERREIAVNCVNMDNKFSTDVIFAMWKELFCSLQNTNQ
ncbi:MAG: glycosyltransferase [Salinivirgaceae bacterium]|nr:glycosyltransferase [Salinivirgaceae bacterium]